jgi:hypothetical protein
MEGRYRLSRARGGCLTAVGLLLVAGCSDDGMDKRYPVSGTVTYHEKPLEKGQITFTPEAPAGQTASGDIEKGYYRLTTLTNGDGALPGKYRVTITAKEVDYSGLIEQSKGGIPHQRDVMKVNQQAKRLIPAKYEQAQTSGLEKEVKEQSNTFDFNLVD